MFSTNFLVLHVLCYLTAVKLVCPEATVNDPDSGKNSEGGGSVVQRFWVMNTPAQRNQVLRTHIICGQNGLNFTIHTANPYTGTVSISDKYAPCQKRINEQSTFWFYVPSADKNKECTAKIENNEIEASIVLHNDKPVCEADERDIIYQARCPLGTSVYQEKLRTMKPIIQQVSEERPLKKGQKGRYAKLRILRGTEPVERIFIGETVVLSIEADNDAEGIFVEGCSVAPANSSSQTVPVAIIKNGCSLMPDVVSNFKHIPDHLQATLRAFDINSASSLQFECVVAFCGDSCPQTLCQNQTAPVHFRGKRVRRNNTNGSRMLNKSYVHYNTSVLAVPEPEEKALATEFPNSVKFFPTDQQSSTSALWENISIISLVFIFILVAIICIQTRILIRKNAN